MTQQRSLLKAMILFINKHQHCMKLLSQTQKSSVFTAGVALCICLGGLSRSLEIKSARVSRGCFA